MSVVLILASRLSIHLPPPLSLSLLCDTVPDIPPRGGVGRAFPQWWDMLRLIITVNSLVIPTVTAIFINNGESRPVSRYLQYVYN